MDGQRKAQTREDGLMAIRRELRAAGAQLDRDGGERPDSEAIKRRVRRMAEDLRAERVAAEARRKLA